MGGRIPTVDRRLPALHPCAASLTRLAALCRPVQRLPNRHVGERLQLHLQPVRRPTRVLFVAHPALEHHQGVVPDPPERRHPPHPALRRYHAQLRVQRASVRGAQRSVRSLGLGWEEGVARQWAARSQRCGPRLRACQLHAPTLAHPTPTAPQASLATVCLALRAGCTPLRWRCRRARPSSWWARAAPSPPPASTLRTLSRRTTAPPPVRERGQGEAHLRGGSAWRRASRPLPGARGGCQLRHAARPRPLISPLPQAPSSWLLS